MGEHHAVGDPLTTGTANAKGVRPYGGLPGSPPQAPERTSDTKAVQA